MGDVPERAFVPSLRSSPRRRRQLAWAVGAVVVVAVVVAVALTLPNTAGKHKAPPHYTGEGDGGTVLLVVSIMLACLLLGMLYLVIRFVWRLLRAEVEPPIAGGGKRAF